MKRGFLFGVFVLGCVAGHCDKSVLQCFYVNPDKQYCKKNPKWQLIKRGGQIHCETDVCAVIDTDAFFIESGVCKVEFDIFDKDKKTHRSTYYRYEETVDGHTYVDGLAVSLNDGEPVHLDSHGCAHFEYNPHAPSFVFRWDSKSCLIADPGILEELSVGLDTDSRPPRTHRFLP